MRPGPADPATARGRGPPFGRGPLAVLAPVAANRSRHGGSARPIRPCASPPSPPRSGQAHRMAQVLRPSKTSSTKSGAASGAGILFPTRGSAVGPGRGTERRGGRGRSAVRPPRYRAAPAAARVLRPTSTVRAAVAARAGSTGSGALRRNRLRGGLLPRSAPFARRLVPARASRRVDRPVPGRFRRRSSLPGRAGRRASPRFLGSRSRSTGRRRKRRSRNRRPSPRLGPERRQLARLCGRASRGSRSEP